MSLIKSSKFKAVIRPGFQDIDYVLAAQRSAEITSSLEDHQADVLHAVDIVTSLENLNQVMESIQELDVVDAALIEVVGNIAGASSGVHGSQFTPSMEAAEDAGPSMGAKIKAIYDKIIVVLRMIFTKIKAYIAHLFTVTHVLAKNYESLGDKIRQFNFVNAAQITLKDIPNAKGGPQAILTPLSNLSGVTQEFLLISKLILDNQIEFIYQADSKEDIKNSSNLSRITVNTKHIAKASGVAEAATDSHNAVMQSKPLINNVCLHTEVFDNVAAANADLPTLFRLAFSARTGFQYNSEETTPASSTFKITHDLAKNIFEGLRPLIHILVSENDSKSFTFQLQAMSKEIEKIEAWIRGKQTSVKEESASDSLTAQRAILYQVGLTLIGTAQLPALIRSHKILESTAMVVISYLNHCLMNPKAAAAPKTESPQAA